MAEALLEITIKNLQSFLRDQLATFWGVEQQAEKLSGYLTAINAVLQDAEEKQITRRSVKLWLQNLSDAAHVLEDILEDCSIYFERRNNSGFVTHTACLTRLNPSDILFRYDIGKRMKKITERFHDINEKRTSFELREGNIIKRQGEDDEWRQTTSADPKTKVYGRDQDKERIVEFLLSHASDNEGLSVYPIVGMGGNGKTTLAQMVFNDERVTTHFDLTMWICVGDVFDVMRILQSIIESITKQNPNLSAKEPLHQKVQEVLQSKKYLLVLDDVWNEVRVKWDELKSLLQCGSGTKGCSILVTTRLEKVADIMRTCPAHQLLGLSEDDNWLLFKHCAFGSDREEREELVAIGKEIVRKCDGSPLASKTMGSLLYTKSDEKQWRDVKESKFWDIPEDEGKLVMRALRLSYFHLKLSLRRCFSFCAVFPEDFRIGKEQLIHLWMANGFIKSRGNLDVEDVGNEVWNELYHRSFFQEVQSEEVGDITFKMHDLFHDLAQSIMEEECVVSANFANLSSRVHHVSNQGCKQPVNMAAFKKVESLRTYLDHYWSPCPPKKFYGLQSISRLRALRTSISHLSAFKNLTHLKYLNIERSSITTLPECICRLHKLQILKLEGCYNLRCLPEHLTQLQDLRHLVIKRCDSLIATPPNIRRLTCLKTLSILTVGLKTGSCLAELHDLQLGGKLHITGLELVKSEQDAKQANLIGKKELNRLYLSWGSNFNPHCVDQKSVLEALRPHSNLKSLGLNGYIGRQWPSWTTDISVLHGLVHVILFNCNNCQRLPTLGKLPHLTTLRLHTMEDVKHIDDDSYDDVSFEAFASLKELHLHGLPKLERMLRVEGVEMLPCLHTLIIDDAPKFKLPCLPTVVHLEANGIEDMDSFSEGISQNTAHLKDLRISHFDKLKVLPDELGNLNALEKLTVGFCDELESFPEHVLQGLTSLRELHIRICKKLKSLSQGVGHLSRLEHLRISYCPELVSLPSNMNQLKDLGISRLDKLKVLPNELGNLNALEKLTVWDCRELESFPEHVLQGLSSLRSLRIESCKKLKSLSNGVGHLSRLECLEIRYCPELVSLPSNMNQLTALREVKISGSHRLPEGLQRIPFLETLTLVQLDSIPDWLGEMTCLQRLRISHCFKLRSLPSSFSHLTHLQELCLDKCPNIEKRCKRETGKDWQKIAHVPQIIIDNKAEITFCENIRFKWNLGKRIIQQWLNKDSRDYVPSSFGSFRAAVDRFDPSQKAYRQNSCLYLLFLRVSKNPYHIPNNGLNK